MGRYSTLVEVWSFLRSRKKYWLLPIVILLLLIGLVIALPAGSALAPFIYPIF